MAKLAASSKSARRTRPPSLAPRVPAPCPVHGSSPRSAQREGVPAAVPRPPGPRVPSAPVTVIMRPDQQHRPATERRPGRRPACPAGTRASASAWPARLLYLLMYGEPRPGASLPAAGAAAGVLALNIHRIAEAGRLPVNEDYAAHVVHAAGCGTTLTLIAMPPGTGAPPPCPAPPVQPIAASPPALAPPPNQARSPLRSPCAPSCRRPPRGPPPSAACCPNGPPASPTRLDGPAGPHSTTSIPAGDGAESAADRSGVGSKYPELRLTARPRYCRNTSITTRGWSPWPGTPWRIQCRR